MPRLPRSERGAGHRARRRSAAVGPPFAAVFAAVLAAALGACGRSSSPPAASPDSRAAAGPAVSAVPAIEHVSHGRFKDVVLVAPTGGTGAAAPAAVVLLLSGSAGWTGPAVDWATRFAARGALVVGIDLPQFQQALNGDGGQCVFPDGDLDNLSRFVQAYRHLPTYLPPILAGVGPGATLAYGTLAQAPKATFGGAFSVGFCPDFALAKPLCAGAGAASLQRMSDSRLTFLPDKSLAATWIVTDDEPPAPPPAPATCPVAVTQAFVAAVPAAQRVDAAGWSAAFDRLVAAIAPERLAPPPASLSDLPIIESPAAPRTLASDRLAIMLSGDGGWAGLDKDIAAALNAAGVPVVGLDSLRYFWTARTPDGIAADLDRMIGYYTAAWHKPKVILIGYSQGADVLPFAFNRLTTAARADVAVAAVLGLSPHALFEFHLSNWLGDDDSGPATLPEMNRIAGIPVLCVYGADESDSLCPTLDAHRFTLIETKGGHHFDGDYAALARQILAAAGHTG
jgi:type IV secretory pathway VirJ component